jgi:hypothetical protein
MNILSSDWISGVGWLYGAPFVGQSFLYRLRDVGYSLLIREVHAERPAVIEESVVHGRRTISITLPPMLVGQPMKKPESLLSLFLHVAQSEDISLRELMEVTPVQIKPSEDIRKTEVLDKITVCLEPFQLLIENMLHSDHGLRPPETTYDITDASYGIRVPFTLKERVFNPKRKTGPRGDYCKISIINNQEGQCYDIRCNYEWDLTVINFLRSNGKGAHVRHLERKNE